MRRFKLDRPIANAVGAPLVALGYTACGYAVRSVGCLPQFVDSEVFGLPVVLFLLAALTVAALTLAVFAGLGAVRQLRVARRLRRSVDAATRVRRWGVAGIGFSLIALGAIAVLALPFLTATCP